MNKIKNYKIASAFIRKNCLEQSSIKSTAHLGSCLSIVDILSVIYLGFLKLKPWKDRDIFILSKGHAALALYSTLLFKKILTKKNLNSFAYPNSIFEEHPNLSIKGVEASTGSLGHGLPIGCGYAYSFARLNKQKRKVIVLLSDGECNEGSVWEAAMFASAKTLNNLTVIVDYNKWQATDRSDQVLDLKSLKNKWEAFNWDVIEIDGHNFTELELALKKKHNRPKAIIANTIKGKGVSFMEDDNNWHYKSPNKEELNLALEEVLNEK